MNSRCSQRKRSAVDAFSPCSTNDQKVVKSKEEAINKKPKAKSSKTPAVKSDPKQDYNNSDNLKWLSQQSFESFKILLWSCHPQHNKKKSSIYKLIWNKRQHQLLYDDIGLKQNTKKVFQKACSMFGHGLVGLLIQGDKSLKKKMFPNSNHSGINLKELKTDSIRCALNLLVDMELSNSPDIKDSVKSALLELDNGTYQDQNLSNLYEKIVAVIGAKDSNKQADFKRWFEHAKENYKLTVEAGNNNNNNNNSNVVDPSAAASTVDPSTTVSTHTSASAGNAVGSAASASAVGTVDPSTAASTPTSSVGDKADVTCGERPSVAFVLTPKLEELSSYLEEKGLTECQAKAVIEITHIRDPKHLSFWDDDFISQVVIEVAKREGLGSIPSNLLSKVLSAAVKSHPSYAPNITNSNTSVVLKNDKDHSTSTSSNSSTDLSLAKMLPTILTPFAQMLAQSLNAFAVAGAASTPVSTLISTGTTPASNAPASAAPASTTTTASTFTAFTSGTRTPSPASATTAASTEEEQQENGNAAANTPSPASAATAASTIPAGGDATKDGTPTDNTTKDGTPIYNVGKTSTNCKLLDDSESSEFSEFERANYSSLEADKKSKPELFNHAETMLKLLEDGDGNNSGMEYKLQRIPNSDDDDDDDDDNNAVSQNQAFSLRQPSQSDSDDDETVSPEEERQKQLQKKQKPAPQPQPKLRTGHWSPKEHELFLEGLEEFGHRQWKEIAGVVKTRNRLQVQDHSTNCFMEPNLSMGPWSTKEHELFLMGMKQHGESWKQVAMVVKTRSYKQVASYANRYFKKMKKSSNHSNDARAGNATRSTSNKRSQVTEVKMPPLHIINTSNKRSSTGSKKNLASVYDVI